MNKIDLVFYGNDNLQYKKGLGIGPMWDLIQTWSQIATDCNVKIESKPEEQKIAEYRKKCTGKDHPIPHRHRTILEVNKKLIYFDCQDQPEMGADLHLVPDLFDLCIKFQYCPKLYDKVPFKVSPFTYFCLTEDKVLQKYRKIRSEIRKSREFKSSMLWAGTTKKGKPNRRAVERYLKKFSHKKVMGLFSIDEYFNHTCETAVGASAKGTGEFCHRDMEFMAIGTPFFRKAFKNTTYDPIISNVHYYTIGGDEVGINKTMEHFLKMFEPNGELKEFSNEEWDKHEEMSNKGMQWYDNNASHEASLKLLLKILEENKIV